jgi:hypothetical protein
MRLSSIGLGLGLVVVGGVVGCGAPQPRYFKVAIDPSPLGEITAANAANASCFVSGASTEVRSSTTLESVRRELEWAIWDGVEGKQYLELPRLQFELGDSPAIDFSGLIEGAAKDLFFLARRTDVTQPSVLRIKNTVTTSVKITFREMGMAPTGTVDLQSSYACTANPDTCPAPVAGANMRSCAATLNFVSRQIPVTEFSAFGQ